MNETLAVRVSGLRYEAEKVISVELVPLDDVLLPPFDAGAHITLCLPDGLRRPYSILSSPQERRRYVVAVLASLESRGDSRFIHESLRCGSILHIGPPKNHFSLRQHDGETVLIAGGIGITPILCMYRELREHGNAARLLYLARRKSSAAFMDVISEIGESVDLHFDDEHEGNTLPLHSYLNQFDADTRFYCCGPYAMLSSFTDACTELEFAHHYIERFRSDDSGGKDELSAFRVRLVRSDCELTVPSDRSILEVIENAGVDVNHSCRQGICGACETTVVAALPDHRDQILTMAEREVNRIMMICVSRSLKPVISLDL